MFYNNKRWTAKEEKFLIDNAGTLTPEQIAKELKKTATAVKLYMHRKRIHPAERVARNLLREMLTGKFTNPEYFTPTREFYRAISMSQKRWWDLYYGRETMSDEEYKRLSVHFSIELEGVGGDKQLSLFEDGNSNGDH